MSLFRPYYFDRRVVIPSSPHYPSLSVPTFQCFYNATHVQVGDMEPGTLHLP
ncbi:hypothetical protein BGZ63DRAFT_382627 [Mariannaea sp. PMI_226]|nr:hypothetical protein BGZ63DRAFT_382627 [Mariannaea sp. PMI_226]